MTYLGNLLARVSSWLAGLSIWNSRLFRFLVLLLSFVFFVSVVVTPLSLGHQTIFAIVVFVTAYVLQRVAHSQLVALVLIVISTVASLRYMYWRITETLGFEQLIDAFFGYGLLLAELYALLTLFLSYFQSAWPLRRQPILMPDDITSWPTVDVYVPTYNESLSVVRQTVLTAKAMDWPADRLRIYILDDGRREEFRQFAETARVGYLTRPDNKHAKAGNINAALTRTDGEYIVIFDSDHIPTRSFLQICMGWFLKDPKLGMLQTPHVFFSPDPMEHNLDVFHRVPNEGQLFYGLTQDGNDLWNATFFCGSCAVLRREHLMQIGGVAIESVTEDALTALKMNRAGLNTAYLALPQAAGLATENLSRHIGQRIRWAQGMAQIMRSHNPLLGKGLTLGQRVCYLSASLHFFYGLPRLVFLTAPLAYLFFGARVFEASALMILAYALPHVLHAQLTNFRIQGKFRHSFWNEVYESVLAWYLMFPTLATLIKPDRARFKVTDKGGTMQEAYFDWRLARPYIILLVLNLAGMAIGIGLLLNSGGDRGLIYTALFNMAWTLHNIVICSASVAVAGEQRQVRSSPRVELVMRATLSLPSGHRIVAHISDFSSEGLGLILDQPMQLELGSNVAVSLYRDELEYVFPAEVRFAHAQKLGLHFLEMSTEQQVDLARMTFGRADIWAEAWNAAVHDEPITAIKQIGRIGLRGFHVLFRETGAAMRAGARNLRRKVTQT